MPLAQLAGIEHAVLEIDNRQVGIVARYDGALCRQPEAAGRGRREQVRNPLERQAPLVIAFLSLPLRS